MRIPDRACNTVVAIVVTYNRKNFLLKCLKALLNQCPPCDIVVVDNASTDGTQNLLSEGGLLNHPQLHYVRLKANIGGAGGFHYGLQYAFYRSWEWFWLMDDDALPEETALANLLKNAENPYDVYGSVAFGFHNGKEQLSTPTSTVCDGDRKSTMTYPFQWNRFIRYPL
jgi:GT2 family glycosyltransferase